MSKMVVLGASSNPERYSYKAVTRLLKNNFEVVAVGKKEGFIGDIPIIAGQPPISNVHTVLIYVSPFHQGEIFDYVISLLAHSNKLGTLSGKYVCFHFLVFLKKQQK